jgi:hypothetical protein
MAHIFISYSRKDVDAAIRLRETLAKAGYETWIDEEIPGGDLWKKRIVEAIEVARAFLVLLSPNSVTSDQVRKELDMADKRKKVIFPVVIASMKIPPEMEYSLEGLQQIDLVTSRDAGESRLLDALKSLHALEEQGAWHMMDTEEGRKKLNAILAAPSRSTKEKIDDFVRASQQPTKAREAWEGEKARKEARIEAINAEQNLLREKKVNLEREAEAGWSAKVQDIDRQIDALGSERTEISDKLTAMRFEAISKDMKRYDKVSEKIDKILKSQDKLVQSIIQSIADGDKDK